MKNVTAVAGDILVLRCYVSGYPVHSIKWKKGQLNLAVVCKYIFVQLDYCCALKVEFPELRHGYSRGAPSGESKNNAWQKKNPTSKLAKSAFTSNFLSYRD